MARHLSIEFVTELLEAFLVVYLLSLTRLTTFAARVAFVTVAGALAAIATNISYWNWYGFPGVYTAAYMLIQVVGFLCIGLVAAWVLKKQPFAPGSAMWRAFVPRSHLANIGAQRLTLSFIDAAPPLFSRLERVGDEADPTQR